MLTNAADVTHATVMRDSYQPLVAEALHLAPLAGDLVRVRVRAVGMCRCDLAALGGPLPDAPAGRAGSRGVRPGRRRRAEVRFVEPGDTVVLSWLGSCWLQDVNEALGDVRAGAGLRTVITMEDQPS